MIDLQKTLVRLTLLIGLCLSVSCDGQIPRLGPSSPDVSLPDADPLPTDASIDDQDTNYPIIVYDIRHFANKGQTPSLALEYFDRMLTLQTLQGIVNRNVPRLYFVYVQLRRDEGTINVDENWFSELCDPSSTFECRSDFQELDGRAILRFKETDQSSDASLSIDDLIANYFLDDLQGLVVWDSRVHATSLAAASIAGATSSLAVRYSMDPSSLYQKLGHALALPVTEDLYALDFTQPGIPNYPALGDFGPKSNVYRWLTETYINTAKLDTRHVAWSLDSFSTTVTNESWLNNMTSHINYYVSNRAIIVDLAVLQDYTPCDDPLASINSDWHTANHVLQAANRITSGLKYAYGFPPWPYKYSSWRNCGLSTDNLPPPYVSEHRFVNLLSSYGYTNVLEAAESGASGDSIGQMPNMSFFSHLKNDQHHYNLNAQAVAPAQGSNAINGVVYLLVAMADYESAGPAHIALQDSKILKQSTSPSFPVAWLINPNTFDLAPQQLTFILRTKTQHDYFVGEAGYGYFDANLFSEKIAMAQLASRAYDRYGLSITGFTIFTHNIDQKALLSPEALDMMSAFSGDGLGTSPSDGDGGDIRIQNRVPMINVRAYFHPEDDPVVAVQQFLAQHTYHAGAPNFWIARSIFMGRATVQTYIDELKRQTPGRDYRIVDPYTFFYLLRQYLGSNNNYRASYLQDTFPKTVKPNQLVAFSVTIRNDGWDTWQASGVNPYGIGATIDGQSPYPIAQLLSQDVAPSQSITVDLQIQAPSSPGMHELKIDLKKENITWFESQLDIPRYIPFTVE
ncbi:MAG: hypothetical protein IPJ88_07065 [Myxococcales bacterium]|nr:MAG: hypothetical protein IPJ88_07065 [Myxococcales bacterium]